MGVFLSNALHLKSKSTIGLFLMPLMAIIFLSTFSLRNFFAEVKSILADGGIVAANTFSSSKLYQHESATYFDVFGDFVNIVTDENSNRIILAGFETMPSQQQLTERANKLASKLTPYDVDLQLLREHLFYTKGNQDWPADTKVL